MTKQLTDSERALAEKLAALIGLLVEVQAEAKAVRAAGGDVQAAFMSQIPEEDQAEMAMQWPLISMFLGV